PVLLPSAEWPRIRSNSFTMRSSGLLSRRVVTAVPSFPTRRSSDLDDMCFFCEGGVVFSSDGEPGTATLGGVAPHQEQLCHHAVERVVVAERRHGRHTGGRPPETSTRRYVLFLRRGRRFQQRWRTRH